MSNSTKSKKGKKPTRDAARSKSSILSAALLEFSEYGHAGARIDRIAKIAGVSKPLIYDYFGDKDDLYTAALREAYVQIRASELTLQLDDLDPESAIKSLVTFTLNHFRSNPWFVSMLNTENLRGGSSIRKIHDVSEIQSNLVGKLEQILERGARQGVFKAGVNPVDFYISIASLCYFPISNIHTLRAVFGCPIDDEWLAQRAEDASQMLLKSLYPDKFSDPK